MAITPAIIIKSQFTYPNRKQTYKGYLEYINRKNARKREKESFKSKKDLYVKYIDYVGDGKKNGQLFNEYNDFISLEQKRDIIKQFNLAEELGSPLWKDVISFDNKWLEEQGLYDPKTHWLNESKMKNVVREAMNILIENEKMRVPVWIASFHYNTDNIHVHIATVELDPSHLPKVKAIDPKTNRPYFDENGNFVFQYRGKRKPSTLKRMKSTVANKIIDRTPTYKRIDALIRDNARKIKVVDLSKNNEFRELLELAIENMPLDFKQWRYGYKAIDNARPYIDKISELYMEKYQKDKMEELIQKLDEQVELSQRLYGSEGNHENYKENKLIELKRRLGNAVIEQMKTYYKKKYESFNEYEGENRFVFNSRRNNVKNSSIQNEKYQYDLKPLTKASIEFNKVIFLLKKAMSKTFKDFQIERNISEFDRMMEGLEK